MLGGGEYSFPEMVGADAECITIFDSAVSKRKSKSKNRFNDDQIKSLENIFETESKLEPRKKLQLARDLGLQPRQVAIWFQNKRARWKSKQLERDYEILRANYNNLASQFEVQKKEKQSLVIQLKRLRDQLEKPGKDSQCCVEAIASRNKIDGGPDYKDNIKSDIEVKPSLSLDGSEHGVSVLSDDDSSIKTEYLGLNEEPGLLHMVETADGTLRSREDWDSLESNGMLEQSTDSSEWWDFWS
ncbi:hypothetical protein RJ639_027342 [Escallonia herrerae]|uniref:Homeobox-leucine zipper protein n=1 Tax=Escallonia herrerae TaxID=1293975 RepID=A0AA88XAN6_9ASTE|nr:hypothetical protein RJ639_027342 [Escallonia herrerae]